MKPNIETDFWLWVHGWAERAETMKRTSGDEVTEPEAKKAGPIVNDAADAARKDANERIG